jgi:hypothetical protein
VNWYGEGKRETRVVQRQRLVESLPCWPFPLASAALVISRDPTGQRGTRFYFATDQSLLGFDIILAFMARWSAEVTFEESRAHLGIHTQRQWSDAGIERCTPCLFALCSLVTFWGSRLYPKGDIPIQQAAWYCKSQATFADVLAAIRFRLWNPFHYPTLPENPDVILLPRAEVPRLVTAACFSP